jgi:AcrR family transcriptional regulator
MPQAAVQALRAVRRRPQARGVVTRQRLLEAAERGFGAKGYEPTSMNEIAEAAGVGVGTLYHHFPDKRALLLALIDHWGDRELARDRGTEFFERYLGADPRAAIQEDLKARAERLGRGGSFQLVLMQLADRDHDVRTRLDRILQVRRDRLCDLVVLGQRRGVFRSGVDPLAAAFLIQNAINVTAIEVCVHRHRELTVDVIIAELTDMICRYMLEESK